MSATINTIVVANTTSWISWKFTPKIVNTGSTSGPGSNTSGLSDPSWKDS